MALDMTSFASALKAHYTSDRVENMSYQNNPLHAMLSKMTDFGGKNLPIPIIYGNPQNTSQDFAVAIAGTSTSKLKDFVLTRNHDYSIAKIDNETLEASKGDANAFLEAATVEIDGAIDSSSRSLAIAEYGTGSGVIGQIAASTTLASTTIALRDVESVTNFEVGQVLRLSAANGGGSVRTGTLTVLGVDRDLGTLTVDANISTGVSAATVNDFISRNGDYDAKIKGLLAWLPSTAPTGGDSFFTVDRSADASRLAGIRFDGSAMPIEEALVSAAARVAREGGRPDYCFMSYSNYANLEKALGSKVQYVEVKVAEVGFPGMKIHGPRGIITVVPDQNCPGDRAFMLQMNVWKLYSLGKAPKILDADGLKMLRDSTADSNTVRVGYYAQLGCRAPGWNCNIKLA